MRVAVFFAPSKDHPLSRAAALWLGREAYSGERLAQPPVDGFDVATMAALTADPRRYGFHATLKPPFRLADGRGLDAVRASLAAFCRGRTWPTIAALRIERIGPFFALTPDGQAPAIDQLAAEVVGAFDGFRARPSDEEIARRRPEVLTSRQQENLRLWGYPYVFDDFRFHMTLTGPVAREHRGRMEAALGDRFSAFVGKPLALDALSLFVEPDPPGGFVVDTRVAMTDAARSMDAA
jgi:putative phosphonate metabolism protein